MSAYDLSTVVDQMLRTNPGVDPRVLAEKIVAQIPGRDLRSVLMLLMPRFVDDRRRLNLSRNPIVGGHPEKGNWSGKKDTAQQAARLRSARSHKSALIRESFQRWLDDNININGAYKRLGDCTYDDLMAAAELRSTQSRALAKKADDYRHVAHEVKKANVAIVDELPTKILRELAERAA